MSAPEWLGMWIAYHDRTEGGNIEKIIARCNRSGIKWLAIKSGNTDVSKVSAAHLQVWIPKLHDAGIKVYTWSYCYPSNFERQVFHIGAMLGLGADGHILDPETEWEFTGSPVLANDLMTLLRADYPDAWIAYAPFDCPDYHPSYPYQTFSYHCNAVMPQAYWTEHDNRGAIPTLERCEKQFLAGETLLTTSNDFVHPIGVTYGLGSGWGKPPGHFRVTDLADFIERYPNRAVSLYSYEAASTACWDYLERLTSARISNPSLMRLGGV